MEQTVELTTQTEPVTRQVTDEIDALLRDMYSNTVASSGIPKYDFDWPRYEQVDRSGMLLLCTIRYDGMLAGFVMYLVVRHPHHRTVRSAECDAIAINHTIRGHGIGRMLYEFAEKQLRERGVKFVTHRFRVCYDEQPVFPKWGFKLEEHVYKKEL